MPLTKEERKERKRISDIKYRKKNREKLAAQNKERYEKNREKELKRQEEYRNGPNREKELKRKKDWAKNNPKNLIINSWVFKGIIDDDFDGLYEAFIKETNCWICGKKYNKDIVMDRRCLDHNHHIEDEPNVRYICCNYCNLHIVRE